MKFVVLVLVLTVIHAQYIDWTSEEQAISDECMKQEKVDPAKIKKYMEKFEYSNDRNFKCFLKCWMLKDDFITEAGLINEENVKMGIDLSPKKSAKIVNTCKGRKGADACEIAYEFSKCITEQLLAA